MKNIKKKNWNVVKYVKQNYNLHRKLKYVKRKNFFFYFKQTSNNVVKIFLYLLSTNNFKNRIL